MAKKAIVLWSGGIDSTVCLYRCLRDGYDVHALYFDYGQQSLMGDLQAIHNLTHAVKRLDFPGHYCGRVTVQHNAGSHYVCGGDAVEYAEGMTPLLVPGRNTLFAMTAYGQAVSLGAEIVVIGINSSVHEDGELPYPDCTPHWVAIVSTLFEWENTGLARDAVKPKFRAPLIKHLKDEIVAEAKELGVPLEHTWGCFFPTVTKDTMGRDQLSPCGKCGSCMQRKGLDL